jgi:hypothetical protein
METKLYKLNNYFRLADLAAIQFKNAEKNYAELEERYRRLLNKYANVFNAQIVHNIPLLFVVLGHLAAAIVEGSILAPLVYEMTEGMISNPYVHLFIAYAPILMFLAFTIAIGRIYHRLRWIQDDFNPQKSHFNTFQYLTALAFTIIYLVILLGITETALSQPGQNDGLAALILGLGTIEMILGYFAVSGWQVSYAYFARFRYRTGKGMCKQAMDRHSHQCDLHFTYYQQALRQYVQETGIQEPFKTNQRIQDALNYCQTKNDHTPDDPFYMALEETLENN